MTIHDFRYTLLSPQHTLIECRNLAPGRYQVTGNGGAISSGDTLRVTLKGSRELFMDLKVEKVRHLINPPGQWLAVASGPVFRELSIHDWQLDCDGCQRRIALEFAVESDASEALRTAAAETRLGELGWCNSAGRHLCPTCREQQP